MCSANEKKRKYTKSAGTIPERLDRIMEKNTFLGYSTGLQFSFDHAYRLQILTSVGDTDGFVDGTTRKQCRSMRTRCYTCHTK